MSDNPHSRFGPRQPKGFTLVELLVVIGIIALLMSILLPTLGRVKERANAIKCASGLRQFGLVLQLYAKDNRDQAPIGYADNKHAGYMVHQGGRWEVLGNLFEKGYLDSGIESFYCPSKMDPRWQFRSADNPWPPPPPNNGLTRLGMTVRPQVQFNDMVPVSSTNDAIQFRKRFPKLIELRGKAIAAEMFGEPVNAGVAVDPTLVMHGKYFNVFYDDNSVRSVRIDARDPQVANGPTIADTLKQLAALQAVPTGAVMNQIYLDEQSTPKRGIWHIFDITR